jgi:hypothetical protein
VARFAQSEGLADVHSAVVYAPDDPVKPPVRRPGERGALHDPVELVRSVQNWPVYRPGCRTRRRAPRCAGVRPPHPATGRAGRLGRTGGARVPGRRRRHDPRRRLTWSPERPTRRRSSTRRLDLPDHPWWHHQSSSGRSSGPRNGCWYPGGARDHRDRPNCRWSYAGHPTAWARRCARPRGQRRREPDRRDPDPWPRGPGPSAERSRRGRHRQRSWSRCQPRWPGYPPRREPNGDRLATRRISLR